MLDPDDLPPELRDAVRRPPVAEQIPIRDDAPEVPPYPPEQQTDDRIGEEPFLRHEH